MPPKDGIAFASTHLSIRTGLATPAGLLINPSLVALNDTIELYSDLQEIVAEPRIILRGDETRETPVIVKILKVKSDFPGLTGKITARWRAVTTTMDVTTTARDVLTPIDGLEFERDEYNVRVNAIRHLRLFVDIAKIPLGSEVVITVDGTALDIPKSRITVDEANLITPLVAQLELQARGTRPRSDIIVSAAYAEYVAGTIVSVVKRDKIERGKQGLFKGYRFQPLERKVQTLWLTEGYILINTKDPVNERYFGDDPGTAVEENAYCQVRLADLILNECLQIMVAQALDGGRLDRRFPNNPEIDVRNYVDEKKFEIGAMIHEKFVTKI
jgi:hypothetical protein